MSNEAASMEAIKWKHEHRIAMLCAVVLGIVTGAFIGTHEANYFHHYNWLIEGLAGPKCALVIGWNLPVGPWPAGYSAARSFTFTNS